MNFTDNSCSGSAVLGTMALKERYVNYVYGLTISDSSFERNISPKGSAIYSSLAVFITLIDINIIDNQTTE